jgi:predicted dienelactone hydrolase
MKNRIGWTMPSIAAALAAVVSIATSVPIASAHGQPNLSGDACAGPPGDPAPGTAAWHARETRELQTCSWQGSKDYNENPLYQAGFLELSANWTQDPGRGIAVGVGDPLRYPKLHWDGTRGRYEQVWIATANGGRLSAELFAPLDCKRDCRKLPKGLKRQEAPYPVVLIVHGGGGAKEPHWQTAEVLAEAGYFVVNIDVPGGVGGSQAPTVMPGEPLHLFSARAALDYALSRPWAPTAQNEVNPWWQLVDRRHVAMMGQSLGAIATSYLAQVDDRVDTSIAYDGCEYVQDALGNAGPEAPFLTVPGSGCRTSPRPLSAAQLKKPRLALQADYFNVFVPAVQRTEPPDPHLKDEYHRALVSQNIDSMHVSLRASGHNESTFARYPTANTNKFNTRYGMAVHHYYTLAWLDYQLKGERRPDIKYEACRRLTARVFDDFADVHEFGTGRYDPERAVNVPWKIGGQRVENRLSYHFASGYFLGGGAVQNHDLRDDDTRARCERLLRRRND